MVAAVQRFSAAVAVLGPGLVLLYDWTVWMLWGRDATITAAVQRWCVTWVELPYITAGLMVWLWLHLFARALAKELGR